MLPLKDNKTYNAIAPSFSKLNAEESLQTFQGFVLGYLCGPEASHKEILHAMSFFLNGAEPFSGQAIAMITTLILESERDLKAGIINLFIEQEADKAEDSARMQHFIDVARGFVLSGARIEDLNEDDEKPKKKAKTRSKRGRKGKEQPKEQPSEELPSDYDVAIEIIQIAITLSTLDPEDPDFSEEEFQLLCATLKKLMIAFYHLYHGGLSKEDLLAF